MSNLLASFGKPFAYQVAAYRLRLMQLRQSDAWDDVWQAEHDVALMVAGAQKADILADFAEMLDKVVRGATLEEFRRDFRAMVAKKGWQISKPKSEGEMPSEAYQAWRTKVIYKTNLATSYAAGRMAQLRAGGFKFFVYRHGSSLEPRLQHLAWDGLVLPVDHPFWDTHAPPNGWGCRCSISGADSASDAKRVGGQPEKQLPDDWQNIDPLTRAPIGIDRGWAYSPGARVANVLAALKPKIMDLPAPLAADMVDSWPDRVIQLWAEAFGKFVDAALANRVEKNFMIVGALKPEWIKAAKERGLNIAGAEIVVVDREIQHSFRGTDLVTAIGRTVDRKAKVSPLDFDWYRELPVHLRSPKAVLLDRRQKKPVLQLIYDVPGSTAKLIIKVNAHIQKAKGIMNLMKTGRLIKLEDIKGSLGDQVELIDGVL